MVILAKRCQGAAMEIIVFRWIEGWHFHFNVFPSNLLIVTNWLTPHFDGVNIKFVTRSKESPVMFNRKLTLSIANPYLIHSISLKIAPFMCIKCGWRRLLSLNHLIQGRLEVFYRVEHTNRRGIQLVVPRVFLTPYFHFHFTTDSLFHNFPNMRCTNSTFVISFAIFLLRIISACTKNFSGSL